MPNTNYLQAIALNCNANNYKNSHRSLSLTNAVLIPIDHRNSHRDIFTLSFDSLPAINNKIIN